MKKGWRIATLHDMCEMYQPKTISSKDMVPNGKYPVFGANGVIGRYDKYNHEESQLLITCRGATCGTVNVSQPRSWITGNAMVVRPRDGSLDFSFLTYLLRGGVDLSRAITGAAQPQITRTNLAPLEIRFPESLPEQRRIVGILDEAFAGLATAEANAARNLQNAREIFDSHLHAVFSQRGEGWMETTIGDLGRVSMCKRIFKQETSATGDIPFYKIGTFGREPDAYIQSETYNQYRAKYPFPKKGDVLISAAGTIGRRVRYDGEPAYFQDSNIVWIDNDEERVLNDYLYHFYGSCQWNCTTGATISRLYNDDLRAIALAFPVSHQQQRHIVEKLDALAAETQRLTLLCEQKQAALAALKASLLHCAFSGEL